MAQTLCRQSFCLRSFCLLTIALPVLLGLAAGAVRAAEISAPQAAVALEKALTETIARAEKSVVAIARVRVERPSETFPLEFRPDPFRRRMVPPTAPQPTDPDFIPNEYGTGVVVDRRGLILTAYHVLAEDSEYYVTTHERKVYKALPKGADPRSDLAVLAIDATDLAPIAFGDAAGLKKGQIVVALGNPYAIARDGQVSAAWGIVANLARKAVPTPDESEPSGKPTLHHFGTLIQTDAKLNLGTSGGPLLNLKGEMVGLCVALAATTGYERSAGYAIPVDRTFRRAVETLKEGREVEYGFLGVQPVNLQPQEVLSGLRGMRVRRVVSGTPADRSGLKTEDIITAVDDTPIYDADGLVLAVGRLPVEQLARLSVIRNGRKRTLDVTLTKYPVRGKKIITTLAPQWRGLRIDYSTAVVDYDPQARSGLAFFEDGVVVSEVQEDTPAWAAGLRRGMKISHVGRVSVRTPKQFHLAVARKTGPVQLRMADEEKSSVTVDSH